MKNITNLCIDLQEGKISKKDFLREARMTFPNYITNVNTFKDTIKILKSRNLISEGCNCENQLEEAVPRDEFHDDPIDFDTDNLKIPKRSLRIDRDTIEPAAPSEEDLEILRNLDVYGNEDDMFEDEYEWEDLEEDHIPDDEDEEIVDDYVWKIDKDEYDIEDDYDAELELIDFDNETLREAQEPKFKPMGSKYDGSDSKYNGIEGGDEVDPLEQQMGMRYERSIDPTGTTEKWLKKVNSNLSKQPRYYTQLSMAGWDAKKIAPEVKKRTDLPVEMDKKMSNTTDKLNKMESPKGIEKDKASANKAKKETAPKIKVKDLTHKAVRAKGIKGVMDMTGGKMKKVKGLNELLINDPNKKYQERKANQDINESENNDGILNQVQSFIDSACPEECKEIQLTEKNLKVYLKYDYWDELPSNVLSELETKFDIKVESSNEGGNGIKTYYILSPKITSDMVQEIKRRIKKLFKK